MKRGILVVSVFLLAIGLELTAGTFSVTVNQVARGLDALTRFPDDGEFPLRFAGGALLVAAGLGGTALGVWTRVRERRLVVGRSCPRCGNGTRRVRRRLRHRILTRLLGVKVVRRRCKDCGWVGLARSESGT